MLALIAVIVLALYTFGVAIPHVNLLGLGLVFLALHFVVPWTPWGRTPPV